MVWAVISTDPPTRLFFLKKINDRLKALAGVAADIGNAIVLLMNEEDALAARKLLREYVASEVNWSGLIALSNVIKQSACLPREYRLATQSLQIAEQLGRHNEVFYYHEYAIYAPLFSGGSSVDIDVFVAATIGDLVASDRDRKTELIRTFLTFLDHQQNARATARKLKVHVNTVHNRLEAINATLGPWQLNNRSLEIHLALRLFILKERPKPSE
jgi:sugar diacid utilization regulator